MMRRVTKADLQGYNLRQASVFLKSDSRIPLEDAVKLTIGAALLYFNGKESVRVKAKSYEGRVYTKGEWQTLGAYGGQKFYADVHTPRGEEIHVTFLFNERIFGQDLASRLN